MKKIFEISGPILIILLLIINQSCKKADEIDTVTDIDGNVYNTVTIGTQVWMVENLKTTKYRNGDLVPNITDNTWGNQTNGAYCDYNNNPDNSSTYGRLYNWEAVNDNRHIAPTGWHVPSDDDWTTLKIYLGDTYVDNVAGGKLKEAGTLHWQSPNTGATNETGFTALPAGSRSTNGSFDNDLGTTGCWWSSTAYSSYTAYVRYINNNSSDLNRTFWSKDNGLSIRCLKDN